MFDTSRALADMANQIRACRSGDGLTLQQLATRSGVAASTIHKVEARQMVPTVSVLLKIAKGLRCRPEELIRDRIDQKSVDPGQEKTSSLASGNGEVSGGAPSILSKDVRQTTALPTRNVGVWQLSVSRERRLPTFDLAPQQRAIVMVEHGEVDLHAGDQRVRMDAGDCIEVEGCRIQHAADGVASASLTLIASPAGNLDLHLGPPRRCAPAYL